MNTRSAFKRKAANWANDVMVLFEVPRIRASDPTAVAGLEVALPCDGGDPSEIGGVSVFPGAAEKGKPSFAESQDGTS